MRALNVGARRRMDWVTVIGSRHRIVLWIGVGVRADEIARRVQPSGEKLKTQSFLDLFQGNSGGDESLS
jgi:hypothetical protein